MRAMVDRIDQNVGRVVGHLKRTGQYDNTLVIFLSDNGAEGAIVEAMPIMGPVFAKLISDHCDNSLDNLGRPGSYASVRPPLGTGRDRAVTAGQDLHHRGRHPRADDHPCARR